MKRLVLFDIDGTLIRGGALWRKSFEYAVTTCFPSVKFPRIAYSGKTDKHICRDYLQHAGITKAAADSYIERILQLYLGQAREGIGSGQPDIEVLPGIVAILELLLATNGITLGLLTGNIRQGADLKLGAAGLVNYFEFGVYGDDHWDRYELPAIAVRKAQERYGILFAGKEVVIIGDTPHDVNCGKSIGVKSIAVGTGVANYRESLLAAGPDYFFEDLSDTTKVLQAIVE